MPGPDDQKIGLLFQKGFDLHRQGKFAEAEKIYREILRHAPCHFDALHLLGLLTLQAGRKEEGVGLIERAISVNPRVAAAYNNLGNGLKTLGQTKEALSKFDQALDLDPNLPETHDNRGLALNDLGRFDEAIRSFSRAIELKPDFTEALFHRGNAFRCEGKFEEALADFNRVVGLRPDFAGAFCNRGNALMEFNRFKEAVESFEAAIQIRPDYADAIFNLGMCELKLGRFEKGWEHYEARKKGKVPGAARAYKQPPWRGENIDKKTLFIYSEQGLGDTLQFCRYAQMAEKRGAHVIVAAQKPLHRLLRPLRVIDENQTPPDFDFHCAMLSLPLAFKTTLATIPADVPYLSADAAEIEAFRAKLPPGKKKHVGLVWAGRMTHDKNHWRSMDFAQTKPLWTIKDVAWVSLQHEIPQADGALFAASGLIDWGRAFSDMADTAAAIAALDLVITVDTSVAHLAGALGKTVWILLPFSSEWRWLAERDDSPWYPTARLLRQQKPGDWESVAAEAAEEAGKFIKT